MADGGTIITLADVNAIRSKKPSYHGNSIRAAWRKVLKHLIMNGRTVPTLFCVADKLDTIKFLIMKRFCHPTDGFYKFDAALNEQIAIGSEEFIRAVMLTVMAKLPAIYA